MKVYSSKDAEVETIGINSSGSKRVLYREALTEAKQQCPNEYMDDYGEEDCCWSGAGDIWHHNDTV